jgi:glycosyltransferase involved in cell wall biosynthesis
MRGLGGVGNHVYELSHALARLGNDVTIIAQSDSSWTKTINENLGMIGIPGFNLKGLDSLYYSRALYRKLRSLVEQNSVDAIQFHNLTGLVPYLHRKTLVIPTWTKCHGVNDPYTANLDIAAKLRTVPFLTDATLSATVDRLCYKLSPHIIANSGSTKDRLLQHYHIDPARVSVIYNGVNHDLFNTGVNPQNLRTKLGLGDSTVLLYVGDFSFLKGIVHLLHGVKRLLREVRDVFLLLVGGYNNASRTGIVRLVRELGIEKKVRIEEYVPHTELPKYYSISDICIVPSLCEPFGNVALEAMACGRPVVAFRAGGLAEIVNANVGITVEPEGIESLAKAILRLIKNEDLRIKMGEKAADYSKKFTWDKTAKKTLGILERLRK